MNRSELVRAVAEHAGSDEAVARRHVDAVFESVMERVAAGERVTVTGFGTFDRLSRPARSARNPRTGAPVEVAAAEVPRFRSGQTFRTRVAGGGAVLDEGQAVAAAPPEGTDGVVAEPPSPKEPKAAKNGKKAKKGTNSKKALKKIKSIKPDALSSAKNGKNGKPGKKKQAKGKTRAKAGK